MKQRPEKQYKNIKKKCKFSEAKSWFCEKINDKHLARLRKKEEDVKSETKEETLQLTPQKNRGS